MASLLVIGTSLSKSGRRHKDLLQIVQTLLRWDIMLGRCFVASNVTVHPAVEVWLATSALTID